MRRALLTWPLAVAGLAAVGRGGSLSALPGNQWTLLHEEDGSGGKMYSRVVWAESVGRLYLWGVGGTLHERNRYDRYELESFTPGTPAWTEALPQGKSVAWADGKWPPFRLHGYGGTQGARIRMVRSMGCNRVAFHTLDGVARPSPVPTFHQCCWDPRRKRILHVNGGRTFALDPATNAWTDLAPATSPTACGSLAWGSACYEPVNDEVVLFGGGLALNLEGGARTWLYECAANAWRRPELEAEPPLRCTAPIVFDPASGVLVLFGGYNQQAALNDTWVYRCKARRWERRSPAPSPPPMFAPAMAAVPGGGILVCGTNALAADRRRSQTRANRETWLYDAAADAWRPVGRDLELQGYRWLTAAGSPKHGVVFLVAFAPKARRTYAFRYDTDGPAAERKGAPPGTVRWKYPDQKASLEDAPQPEPETRRRALAELPANTPVAAQPPGLVVSKTWSSACIDTDRGEVLYAGGGHSGYSGNDIAHYDVAANRWTQSWPPLFPPYLESTNCSAFGWSYGCKPWSQHTYRWYACDTVSKAVVYCARMTIHAGDEVLLDADPAKAFRYNPKTHGYWTWVYDPVARRLHPPSFGRPFKNSWGLCLTPTPKGIYALTQQRLYHARVEDGRVIWTLVDDKGPKRPREYSYEFLPVVYDSKRHRLVHCMGRKETVDVYARGLGDGAAWQRLPTQGAVAIGREAAYIARHDSVLLLGAAGRLFVLECGSNRWRELDVALPKGRYGTESAMVYDPVHDVAVLLIPSRFSGPLQTVLFRHDPTTARYR